MKTATHAFGGARLLTLLFTLSLQFGCAESQSVAPGALQPPSEAISPGLAHVTTVASLPVAAAAVRPEAVPALTPVTTVASLSAPPAATIPAPADALSKIDALCQKYGIRKISGSNATPAELDKLDETLSTLPAGLYSRLEIDYEPSHADPSKASAGGVVAYWQPEPEIADLVKDPLAGLMGQSYVGRIYVLKPESTRETLCHELCHHISLLADQSFGTRALKDLGYKRTDGTVFYNQMLFMQTWERDGTFDPSTVPTDYAKTDAHEHLAELMKVFLRGTGSTTEPTHPIRPEFKGPGVAREALKGRLGVGAL
jgi:hypothetical protein